MKKIMKKAIAGAMAAAMVMGLAACGSKVTETTAAPAETKAAESAAETTAAAPAASSGPVTLRISWWGGDSRHEATQKALDAFMEANPDIKVEADFGAWSGWTDKVATQLAGNSEPDVMQINWNWIYQFSADGEGFYDLNQLKDTIDLTQYSQDLLDQMTIDGKLQGVPVSTTGRVFYWNKTTFDKAGVAIPKSFEDIKAAGKAFQEKLGEDYYPMAAGEYDQMLLLTYYMQQKYQKQWVKDGKLNYTTEELADGFDFLKSMEDSHVWPSQEKLAGDGADSLDKNPNFIDGHYAGVYEWDSAVKKFTSALGDGQELVIGDFPYDFSDTKSDIFKISMAFAVSKNTKYPAEAAKLVNFLMNEEAGVKLMGLERGIVSSKAAQATLEADGVLEGLTFEANKLATDNYSFALDPYYEDSKLKDATGAYYEVIDAMSYDDEDSTELAKMLTESVNSLEAEKLAG